MKRAIVLFSLFIFAFIYVAESLHVSKMVRSIVIDSYNNYGEVNKHPKIVSGEIYKRMCYRNDFSISSENNPEMIEDNKLSFPLTIHWFFGGKVYYHYSYDIKDKNGVVEGGSWDVPATVNVKFSNGKWIIKNYHEAP